MADKVTKEQVAHIAGLAKLELTDEELPDFTEKMDDLLKLLDTLEPVDTSGIKPTYTVTDQIDVMRDDVAKDWHQQEALLKNAPEVQGSYIKVPTIIDEDEDDE